MEARYHIALPSINNAFYKGRPREGPSYRAIGHHSVSFKNTLKKTSLLTFI
jgi:hypothetical protein